MHVADYLVLGRIRARQIRHGSITLTRIAFQGCPALVGEQLRMQSDVLDILAARHNVDIARRYWKDRRLRPLRLEEGKRILEHLGRSELDIFSAHDEPPLRSSNSRRSADDVR